jgi:radical SAM superfamily enzyme YgiQ (UPF0313 family)
VLELARRLREADLDMSWYCNGRIDQVLALDEDELRGLAAAGLRSINIGYETGSQAVADDADKDCDIGGIEELARRFRAADINLSLNFMVGLPGETPDDLLQSLATLHRIHELQSDLDVCWYFYMVAPGTTFWERLIADGRLTRPRTLKEHMRLQTLFLEQPWYYPSPPRDVLREWRSKHKAIVWYFWVAWAAPRPGGPLGLGFDAMRKLARWRLRHRKLRLRFDWRFFRALFVLRTACAFGWAALERSRPVTALRARFPSAPSTVRPSYAPLRSMHGRT